MLSVPKALQTSVVYGRGYAWARTLMALALLLTLLVNPASVLFAARMTPDGSTACDGAGFSLFCVLDPDWARWLSIAVLALVVTGWRPRLTGLCHWWVSSSVFLTATATDGGEQVGAVMTLLLLPLTLLDRRRSHWDLSAVTSSPDVRQACVRVATGLVFLACQAQIALIYFEAGVEKMGSDDWANGTALYYWFQHGSVGMHPALWEPLGRWALSDPIILPLITWSVILFECTLAFSIFIGPRFRHAMFVPAVAFHLGILLLHGITSFSITMVGVLCLYLLPLRSPR